MGEGNFGGDGSVRWQVTNTVDNKGKHQDFPPNGANKGRKSIGVDDEYGESFVVSLRPPTGMSADQFKSALESGGLIIDAGRVQLKLPIEQGVKDQVWVNWSKGTPAR
jgi:hypothetical protein